MEKTKGARHKGRIIAAGFSYALFMVMFFTFASPTDGISGCAGDCFTCHENLKTDKNHKALGTCASCHDGALKNYSIVPRTYVNGGCGDRCFRCHNEWPRNSYHAPLDTCLTCHNM